MVRYSMDKTHIIALGGSSFVREEIDTSLLLKLKKVIDSLIKKGHRFVIITGGGGPARRYVKAASVIGKPSDREKDLLAIKITALNAVLVQTLFGDRANPQLLDQQFRVKNFHNYPVIIGHGQKPGRSTDAIAVQSALDFGVDRVIILGKPDHVYTADMTKAKNTKPIKKMTWKEYQRLIPAKWKPVLSSPVDPTAANLAKKKNISAIVASGSDLANLKKIIEGKSFKGTLISN